MGGSSSHFPRIFPFPFMGGSSSHFPRVEKDVFIRIIHSSLAKFLIIWLKCIRKPEYIAESRLFWDDSPCEPSFQWRHNEVMIKFIRTLRLFSHYYPINPSHNPSFCLLDPQNGGSRLATDTSLAVLCPCLCPCLCPAGSNITFQMAWPLFTGWWFQHVSTPLKNMKVKLGWRNSLYLGTYSFSNPPTRLHIMHQRTHYSSLLQIGKALVSALLGGGPQ